MSERFSRVDGVPSLWERRYNLSSADSFLAWLGDLPAAKTIPLVLPDVSQQPPDTLSLHRHIYRRRSRRPSRFSSLFLSLSLPSLHPHPPALLFFFGSATLPLAARESPLTRRMDDLRISSRSLSPVRSRYRSQSPAPSTPWYPPFCLSLAVFVFLQAFSSSPICLFPSTPSGGGFSTAFPRANAPARLPPPYRCTGSNDVVVLCIAML